MVGKYFCRKASWRDGFYLFFRLLCVPTSKFSFWSGEDLGVKHFLIKGDLGAMGLPIVISAYSHVFCFSLLPNSWLSMSFWIGGKAFHSQDLFL